MRIQEKLKTRDSRMLAELMEAAIGTTGVPESMTVGE